MKIEDINKLTKDSNYIVGIYNYCDQWCERCPLTSRCMNFKLDEKKFDDLQSLDDKNTIFWQKLTGIFEESLTMLKKIAEQEGINLDSFDIKEDDTIENTVEINNIIHIMNLIAKNYIESVNKYFELTRNFEIESKESQIDSIGLEESAKVIRWYQKQIYIKLKRAVKSRQNEKSAASNNYTNDSDGSAKVSLVCIDRSICAWGEMLKHLSNRENEILNIINNLNHLRTIVEKEFPNARSFIRPGFDETNADIG